MCSLPSPSRRGNFHRKTQQITVSQECLEFQPSFILGKLRGLSEKRTLPMQPFVPVLKCTILLHVRSVLRLNARPTASTCAPAALGLFSIPESQTRRRCFSSYLLSSHPLPGSIIFPAPISGSYHGSVVGRCADSTDRQMEVVRACATVIPQFNSEFFPDSNLSKALLPGQMPPVCRAFSQKTKSDQSISCFPGSRPIPSTGNVCVCKQALISTLALLAAATTSTRS